MTYKIRKKIRFVPIFFFLFFFLINITQAESILDQQYQIILKNIQKNDIQAIKNTDAVLEMIALLKSKKNELDEDKLHHNLSILYDKIGKKDQAVYHFLQTRPSQDNKNSVIIPGAQRQSLFFGYQFLEILILKFLTTKQLQMLLIASNVFFWLSLIIILIYKKRTYKLILVVSSIVIFITSLSLLDHQYSLLPKNKAIIKNIQASVYSGPGLSYRKETLLPIELGRVYFIKEKLTHWIKISDNEHVAWIAKDHIIIL